jgi:FOG: TPR repeat, SEL1 subfamily
LGSNTISSSNTSLITGEVSTIRTESYKWKQTDNNTSTLANDHTTRSFSLIKDSARVQQMELSHADSIRQSATLGKSYLHGYNVDMNVVKAKNYLRQASKGNSSRAMYQLGLVYKEETGSLRNIKEALVLLKKAASLRYAPAIVELASMYQAGQDVPQDFTKAFQLYKKAADIGDPTAIYSVGYLYYKGLGTQQSYQNAIDYFTYALKLGELHCIYMLGNCYLHGYGVTQDFEKAKEFFTQAVKKGDDHAVYAAIYHVVDSAMNYPHLTTKSVPPIMPEVANNADADSLQGQWVGSLFTYDWSHGIAESETYMTLNLKLVDDHLTGTWSLKGQPIMQFNAIKDTACWKIIKSSVDNDKNANLRLNSLTCSMNKQYNLTYITGNLKRQDLRANEPMRPTYFVLHKDGLNNAVITNDSIFIINRTYPNPIDNQLNIDFTVKQSDKIIFQIQNQSGIVLFSTKPKLYQPGKHSITIYPSVHTGSYNFVVLGNTYKLNRIIIKK